MDAHFASFSQIPSVPAEAASGQGRHQIRTIRCQYHVSRIDIAGRLHDPS